MEFQTWRKKEQLTVIKWINKNLLTTPTVQQPITKIIMDIMDTISNIQTKGINNRQLISSALIHLVLY